MTAAVQDFIAHVAKVSHAIGFQAGVGGRETAGAIISYLAQHPDKLDAFMKDGVFGWGTDEWITGGCLTWQASDGKVWHPADARAARVAKAESAVAAPVSHAADYIQRRYGVPAKTGGRVVYTGSGIERPGTIVSVEGGCLRIKLDDQPGYVGLYHPTWELKYLDDGDDDGPCTTCWDTGVTIQTERRCACQPEGERRQ